MENIQNSSRVVMPVDSIHKTIALALKEGIVQVVTSEEMRTKIPVLFPPKAGTKIQEFESKERDFKQTLEVYLNCAYNGGGVAVAVGREDDLNRVESLRSRSVRGANIPAHKKPIMIVKTDGGKYTAIYCTKNVKTWLDVYAQGYTPEAWDGKASENGKGSNGSDSAAPKKQRSPKTMSENPKDLVNRLQSIAPNGAVTRGLAAAIEKHETQVLGVTSDWSEVGIPQQGIWQVLKETDRQEKRGRPGVYEVSYTFEVPESLQREFDLRQELATVTSELAVKNTELASLNEKKFGDAEKAIIGEFAVKFQKAKEAYEATFASIEAKKAEKMAALDAKKLADSEYQAALHVKQAVDAKVAKAEAELAELLKPTETPAPTEVVNETK